MLSSHLFVFGLSLASQILATDSSSKLPLLVNQSPSSAVVSISYSFYSGMPEFQGFDTPSALKVYAHVVSSDGNASVSLFTKNIDPQSTFSSNKGFKATLSPNDVMQLASHDYSSLSALPEFFDHPSLSSDGSVGVIRIQAPLLNKTFWGSDEVLRQTEPFKSLICLIQTKLGGHI